jgi:hypothetical protein
MNTQKGESFSFLKKIKFIFNNQEATESSKPIRGSSSSYVLSIHITSSLSLSHETALLHIAQALKVLALLNIPKALAADLKNYKIHQIKSNQIHLLRVLTIPNNSIH